MIPRIGLPRDYEPLPELDTDSANGTDTHRADNERRHERPSDCVGCMPLVNMDITAAVITAFFK